MQRVIKYNIKLVMKDEKNCVMYQNRQIQYKLGFICLIVLNLQHQVLGGKYTRPKEIIISSETSLLIKINHECML